MVCTFFGHKDTPKEKELVLKRTLIELIENENADTFFVGNNGNFDALVRKTLLELKGIYDIKLFVVLAYFPKNEYDYQEYTIIPEGIENVPPKFAINYRNKWMISKSDYVITAVTQPFGGAANFKDYSIKHNKTVIEINN